MKIPNSIKQFLHWFPNQQITMLACATFVIGLLAGRALMSIGMIALLGNALLNKDVVENFRLFTKNKAALLLTGLFFVFGASYLWSTDVQYFGSRMQLMLPFLAMPFAFQSIHWRQKWFDYLAILFVLVCVAGVGWSLYHYLQDKEAIDHAYGLSKSLPTPFGGDHIRFGVAVVVAISFCVQLVKEGFLYKWIIALLAIFLIAYLHILASKTALLSLYIFLIYELLVLIIRQKKIALGFGIMAVIFILPFIFYYSSPSFKNKIYYTKYSFEQLLNNEAETNISDEGRVISYRTAIHVIKQNWLIGVGVGDGLTEMKNAYAELGILTERILYPHNEFLYIALVLGVFGLGYLVFLLIYIFKKYLPSNSWLPAFLLIFIVPLLVEAFFNTQYGIAIFLFFFLMLERRKALDAK